MASQIGGGEGNRTPVHGDFSLIYQRILSGRGAFGAHNRGGEVQFGHGFCLVLFYTAWCI